MSAKNLMKEYSLPPLFIMAPKYNHPNAYQRDVFMDSYSTIKINELLMHTTTWINNTNMRRVNLNNNLREILQGIIISIWK
jgi:hypothetical protein